MKRFLLFTALMSVIFPAFTADLHSWPQEKAVSIEAEANTIQVINVWATWCKPCREEMPMLDTWYRQQQKIGGKPKVSLISIALDRAENLSRFQQQVRVSYPWWRYTGNDSVAWMQSLGNPVGALPFTLIRAPQCGFKQTLLGALKQDELNQVLQAARKQCAAKGKV
ncbi:TlpA family protein disulfide reductase [Stenoxybacter acetivorans]|uniref:TlpA family protein disulfide reductase n=1 Tax=Stenoxybacter acetivorans TaxID=422441 RepID=UPI00055C15CF|nr:TlpA disulfide reductase family protein [Stenoxybacter acetivorans]